MGKRNEAQDHSGEQMSMYDYQLKEVSVRLVLKENSVLYSSTPIRTPEDAVNIMGDLLRGSDREIVCVVNMDTQLRPINYNIVSIGGISSSQVPIANCFKSAIIGANAAAVVLLHSHPSGDVTPSDEDMVVTKRFVQAGKLLDIPVMDHIIIGAYKGEQFSFRENYPEMFYEHIDLSIFPEIDPAKGLCTAEKSAAYTTEKPSVLGRLSEKKSQIAMKDNSAHKHKKQEHSL